MDKEKKQIGNIIAELRKDRGWTQNELAEKLNVSDKAISKWESNKGTPSIDFFPDLAKLFKVSIDYLFVCEGNGENINISNKQIYEGVNMGNEKKELTEQEMTERELNERCKLIISLTKECVENSTKGNDSMSRWGYHEIWRLRAFPKALASVEAYNKFYKLTGKDIRNFDWDSSVKTKTEGTIVVHKLFMHEHMIPSNMINKLLIREYKKGNLSIGKVKEIISKQRICWITKDEDSRISSNGNRSNRPYPIEAYRNARIEIYEENMEEIEKMFHSLELYNLPVSTTSKILTKDESKFSKQLRQYFEENYSDINYQYWKEHYPSIYYKSGCLINVRTTIGGLHLKDINLYIEGGNRAREKFDRIRSFKEKIEEYLGYKLVWQRYGESGMKSTTCRIGRFGIFANDIKMYNDGANPYDFDLDVEKVAEELVKFYEVFATIIENNL